MKSFWFFFLLFICLNLRAQTILSDPSLKIWLRADSATTDANGLLASWPDISGNNHNFYQSNNSSRPSISPSTYYNYPSINFDGNNDFILNDLIDNINTEDLSIFIISNGLPQGNQRSGLFCVNGINNGLTIARSIGSFKAFRIWVNLSAGLNTGSQSAPSTYAPRILSFKREVGVNSKIYLNGTQKGSNSSPGYNVPFTNGIQKKAQ